MNDFAIYKHPDGRTITVKRGWSWTAFLFTWIWALSTKQWLIGGIATAISIGVYAIFPGKFGHYGFADFINAAAMPFFGWLGNEWREQDLQRRGFDLIDTVSARSRDDAMAIYIKKNALANSPTTDNRT